MNLNQPSYKYFEYLTVEQLQDKLRVLMNEPKLEVTFDNNVEGGADGVYLTVEQETEHDHS